MEKVFLASPFTQPNASCSAITPFGLEAYIIF
jgi:hypothetical protein